MLRDPTCMPACSAAVRWCETSILQNRCQTNKIRSDLQSCLGLINVALFPSLLYNLADVRFSFIRCHCRSASERICRLQEALDERKQQFNSMATKYDVLMFLLVQSVLWGLCTFSAKGWLNTVAFLLDYFVMCFLTMIGKTVSTLSSNVEQNVKSWSFVNAS